MTERRRSVRVPASSATLGPGFDSLAAALGVYLELDVAEAGEFSVDAGGDDVPLDRSNLCVRAFESLHSAAGLRFEARNEIPLARGMGSSAAAIVAGLFAADHLYELGNSRDELFAKAVEIEGHPDNVAAAVYGGFVACPPPAEAKAPGASGRPVRIEPPEGVEGILVIPSEQVSTSAAREALPAEVPLADATLNVAAAAQLVLGLERSDPGLIARGLADRLHQTHRGPLYPRSLELVSKATELGAIGATISGAGTSVLVWSWWQDTGRVSEAVSRASDGWADVQRVIFSPYGAEVTSL
ncbi:homoserine kinase [soil metagenome]